MRKIMKRGLFFMLTLGFAAVLFVFATSILPPSSKGTKKTTPKSVIGRFLHISPTPPTPKTVFMDEADQNLTLADFEGKFVLLNVWATWCQPCIKEMPALDQLEQALGGDDFMVLALNQDRNKEVALKFLQENEINNLGLYYEPKLALVRELYVLNYPSGLPLSVLYDREGVEISRYYGENDWVSDEVVERLREKISASLRPEIKSIEPASAH